MNAEAIAKDLEILTQEGNIGFYSRCEVTEIFIHNKSNKEVSNLLTLVVFEDANLPSQNKKYDYLTKPIPINRNYSCGIKRYYTSPQDTKQHFLSFIESKFWLLSGEPLKMSNNLIFFPKQFVPADGSLSGVPLNSILKNNFHLHSGSYVLEGFDEVKSNISFLIENPMALRKLSKAIQNILPIGISKLSDRLGNIILQFPIEVVSVQTSIDQDKNIHAEIIWNPKLKTSRQIEIFTIRNFDQAICNFRLQVNELDSNLILGSYQNNTRHIFFDKNTQLILASSDRTVYLSEILLNQYLGSHEPRVFRINDPNGRTVKEERIEVSLPQPVNIGTRLTETYTLWIKNRLYEEETTEQEETLSFVQYGRNSDDREKALQDIRTLINRYGEGGVCLWDPYLRDSDIMETLYFCKFYNAPLKALGSFDKKKKEILNSEDIKEHIKNNAQNLSSSIDNNNLGINLEFRVQYGTYGWKFHDRFLIFPSVGGSDEVNSRVEAWSLGKSINHLGKDHHILQKVSNPRNILDAFNELWDKLNDPNCLIWKSSHE
jgi:hypothetical protein